MSAANTNTVIAGCGLHHIAVHTRDLDAALALYRDVLGMTVAAEFGTAARKIILLDAGDGSHVELFAPLPDAPAPGSPGPAHPQLQHFALTVDDLPAALEKVRAAGYHITVEPKDVTLGPIQATVAFFEGPSGEIVEFFQTH